MGVGLLQYINNMTINLKDHQFCDVEINVFILVNTACQFLMKIILK